MMATGNTEGGERESAVKMNRSEIEVNKLQGLQNSQREGSAHRGDAFNALRSSWLQRPQRHSVARGKRVGVPQARHFRPGTWLTAA